MLQEYVQPEREIVEPLHTTSILCWLTHSAVPAPNFQERANQRLMVKCGRQLQEMLQLKANTGLLFTPGFSVLPQKTAGMVGMISSVTQDRANKTLVLHR